MVERQARDLEVQGSNCGPSSNFSLELKKKIETKIQYNRTVKKALRLIVNL